jgi:hypothetical protein
MTKLSRGGRKPSPEKARRFDNKVEPWRLLTWPQKGESMTKLSRGDFSHGPKKASRWQSWAVATSHMAPKRRLQADDKAEPLIVISLLDTGCIPDKYLGYSFRNGYSNGAPTWGLIFKINKNKVFKKLCVRMRAEPWRPKTWPQKGKAIRRQSWTVATSHTAPKRRVDDKVEPWRPKTWPQKGDSTTNRSLGGFSALVQLSVTKLFKYQLVITIQLIWLNCLIWLGVSAHNHLYCALNWTGAGFSPSPKKAITSRRQSWTVATSHLAPKRRVDDKPEFWWLLTWPQKGDYKLTTKLNRGGRKPGPKKASRRQSWTVATSHTAPKRRVDDKPESWWLLTWPQKGESTTNRSLGGFSHGPKKAITSWRQSWTAHRYKSFGYWVHSW